MKVSHKECKITQNFVKKKLKAFPSKLLGFYTNKTGATTMDMVDISTFWEYFRTVRMTRGLDATAI